VNVESGEIVEFIVGPSWCKVSPSGRYIAYNESSSMSPPIFVKDLVNGETWNIPYCDLSMCFTPDDLSIIYTDTITMQLMQMPIEGGTPVQLTSSGDQFRLYPDVSPDGKWVMYQDINVHGGVERSIDYPDGERYTFTKPFNRLCALNIETRETVEILRNDDFIDMSSPGQFSPDGKKFCYILFNPFEQIDRYSLYVRDFTPGILNTDGQTEVAEALPAGFAISGNYPNPFNPSTTISFNLPAAGTASLAVYDITGRKVRDLMNGSLTRGAHSAVWDGRDSAGRSVSTGIYLSRLTMNGKSATNRMLLAK
jgi:Tol biopolymer transport system component